MTCRGGDGGGWFGFVVGRTGGSGEETGPAVGPEPGPVPGLGVAGAGVPGVGVPGVGVPGVGVPAVGVPGPGVPGGGVPCAPEPPVGAGVLVRGPVEATIAEKPVNAPGNWAGLGTVREEGAATSAGTLRT